MTASQLRRIRTKLAKARELADDACDLAIDCHADLDMRELTARAAYDMGRAIRALKYWDDRMAINAKKIIQELSDDNEEV